LRFRVCDSWSRVQGIDQLRASGFGLMVKGLELRVKGLGSMVQETGSELLGFGV
jgi:hypothetical protein